MRNFTAELFQLLIDAEKDLSEIEYLEFLDSVQNIGANFKLVLLGIDRFREREAKKREEERTRMKALVKGLSSENGYEETHEEKKA